MLKSELLAAGLLGLGQASYVTTLSPNAQQMFNESMSWMDNYYDTSAGYLYNFGATSALRHETRSSAWYALGLLARNAGSDVTEAEKIITNIITGQYKDPAEQWYGDYQQEPEEPYVGSPNYPSHIYGSFDPNWRGFVGTTFVMAIEEFGALLSNTVHDLVLESLVNATIGDSYRVGGVNDDNLYASYSNPSIMRALVSGWTGRRVGNTNMTLAGEAYAQEIIDLFNLHQTLSEFNSGTYTGVSLFGLTLWSKYLPNCSVMAQNGPRMLRATWDVVSQLWHPGMKNMAGPWDRAYGYDMNKYVSLMALWFWTLLGKENSSLIAKPQVMSHMADYAWAPLFAVLADFQKSLLSNDTVAKLSKFEGERTFNAQAYYPPYDLETRNITTWLSQKLTIGAESFNETTVGGASTSQTSFNPAVVQWVNGDDVAFISLYPTEIALKSEVSPSRLSLTYTNGTASSIFTLVVSQFKQVRTVTGWEDVQGVKVRVSGNVILTHSLSFAGGYGGRSSTIRDFEFWNFTYTMPANFRGKPNLVLDFELV
ncbi:hypothetical protein HD806DRAFT_46620 [Xylariaceae sp. AK1471]|nr:hypothetical protein HD806DRAFT_46620 [Xylariaceae sp. AK1471]